MVKIKGIDPGSPAAKAGIAAGDILVSINGNGICDVLDYRFYITEKKIEIKCERGGQPYAVTIRKGEYDDIGLEFETPLMDKKHSCANRCIFCFIDQLPKGMRSSLYFKDDDSRLSFLHGNYITLTNLNDADIDRIIKMRISPLRVSVHTTNPALRVEMMKNRRAGEVLKYLERVASAKISIDAQIVLCRGINDGAELDRTMRDLLSYRPALESVSVVPAGLTKHREGLYPLSPYTPEESAKIIEQVGRIGDECVRKYGTRIFFCADELYIKAGIDMPEAEYYEDFSQIENGVGLVASLKDEFGSELEYCGLPKSSSRRVSIATGEAAFSLISSLARRVCLAVPGLEAHVYAIKNNFFGGQVTVAGLLTGKDISEQLEGEELGDELIVPAAALRKDDNIFLDDMTLDELSEKLGVPVRAGGTSGGELLHALLGDKA
jgi:putative radical SAM enzyme (TIGR03279 family)